MGPWGPGWDRDPEAQHPMAAVGRQEGRRCSPGRRAAQWGPALPGASPPPPWPGSAPHTAQCPPAGGGVALRPPPPRHHRPHPSPPPTPLCYPMVGAEPFGLSQDAAIGAHQHGLGVGAPPVGKGGGGWGVGPPLREAQRPLDGGGVMLGGTHKDMGWRDPWGGVSYGGGSCGSWGGGSEGETAAGGPSHLHGATPGWVVGPGWEQRGT